MKGTVASVVGRWLMFSILCFEALSLACGAAAAAPVPSPSQFLGIDVGADRTLADYRQIVSYFRALDARRRASKSRSSARRRWAKR